MTHSQDVNISCKIYNVFSSVNGLPFNFVFNFFTVSAIKLFMRSASYCLHIQTHTAYKDHRLTYTYKDISTPPVTCTQQLPVLHLMNKLMVGKIIIQRFTLS